MTPYLRAANVKDGVLDLTDVKEMNFAPPEQQMFSLKQGDVLVTEGSGSLGSVGASAVWSGEIDGPVCFQNTLLRLRPRPGTDPRFLAWWCRHAFADGIFASVALGANIFHISAERVRALPLHYVSLSTQRAIAGYLDRETARIDALIEKKQRLTQLLEERFQRLIHDVVWGEVDQPVPLMRRVQWNRPIMYGIVLPGPDVPDGVPIVKGGDVEAQRLSPDRLARTTPEIEAPYARARLHGADLVFAIRGGIGDVELVPPELEGANITQDVARVAPAADVDPKWLQLVLRSAEVRRQVEQRVTGATIKGLNIWDLKRVCVPPSDEHRQRADLARLSAEESRVYKLVDALRSQAILLAEHRQALITAAVTGVLDLAVVAA
jgi:type I restriction enzyme S subunit